MAALLVVSALDAGGFAIAQDSLSSEPAQPGVVDSSGTFEVPVPLQQEPARQPHTPFANDGAVPFEQLSDDDRALTGEQGEFAEVRHGYEVHQAWSRYSKRKSAEAKAAAASYAAGTEGLDELGVE